MLEAVDTLAAFAKHGTSARAAVALRITQAAVSKRIAALEHNLGFPLLQKSGRNAHLTQAATRFLAQAEPHIVGIREAIAQAGQVRAAPLRLALSESLALSWGGEWMAGFAKRHPEVAIDLHVHRAPLAIQCVAAGKYDVAVTPRWTDTPKRLACEILGSEKMVLLSKHPDISRQLPLDVLTIEESSATWAGLDQQIKRASKKLNVELKITSRIESFAAVVQLAKYGLSHGLAPIGVALSCGFPRERIVDIFDGTVHRNIALTCRASLLREPALQTLKNYLTSDLGARL